MRSQAKRCGDREHGEHGRGQQQRESSWEEHDGGEEREHEGREQAAARTAGPGRRPATSTQTQSAPGTVSMPASFASWWKGRIAGSTSARPTPIAVADERARQAVREPGDEDDSQSGRR